MSASDVASRAWEYLMWYFYVMAVKSWNSSIKSVDAFLGVAVGSALQPEKIQAPNWEMALYIFGVVYGRAVISHLADNPFPTSLKSRSPFPETNYSVL
jgi:hypothetical protein